MNYEGTAKSSNIVNYVMDPCEARYCVKWDWWSGMLYQEMNGRMKKKPEFKDKPMVNWKPSISCCDYYAMQKAYNCPISAPSGCVNFDNFELKDGPDIS